MNEEANIAVAQDVTGSVSVHLYEVTLEETIRAVCLAGKFNYLKQDGLYYVYKSKDEMDPQSDRLQLRVFKLKYAEIEKIQEVLDAIPGKRLIKIHDASNTIIVEDTPENIAKIEMLLSHWDVMPRQVLIEAKILDVRLTDDMSLGVNWNKVLGNVLQSNIGLGTGGFSRAVMAGAEAVSPVPAAEKGVFGNLITGTGTDEQFSAALDALQSKTRVNTLSTPKILAIHGKPATVQVGGQQGYKVTSVSDGIATESIQFIDTGTILSITPYLDDGGNILLNVTPSINSAAIEEGIPVVKRTAVSTWLLARNGETVFIGGLIQDVRTRASEMIPCLGGIPGLGLLLGRTATGYEKSELVVLLTPTLVEAGRRPADAAPIEKTRSVEESFKKEPLTPPERLKEFFFPPDEEFLPNEWKERLRRGTGGAAGQ